jgi:hypothetical protein
MSEAGPLLNVFAEVLISEFSRLIESQPSNRSCGVEMALRDQVTGDTPNLGFSLR